MSVMVMNIMEQLESIRSAGGTRITQGLPDETVERFAASHPAMVEAVEAAVKEHDRLKTEFPELMAMDEMDQVGAIQSGLVNFYAQDVVNPFVSLAARGPWIVTTKGAVIHDNGGYGMLGFGHVPAPVIEAMSKPQVMANVMTPSFSQLRLVDALKREIGRNRAGGCPFSHFLAVNSGSESVSVASRISDINAKLMTDPGGRYAGRTVKGLSLAGGFHGRTGRPAQFSDSTRRSYKTHLATFRNRENLLTVKPNDVGGLGAAFADADSQGIFIEALFMEPVMGEGDPGMAVTPEFYAAARELTEAHGSLLLMDSIQAGLRTTGNLSVVDYPGFEGLPAPDMETYSKAMNAGQYPVSVLAMNERAAKLYRTGVYGNTMTGNPRGMDVGCAVLGMVTDEVRANIVARGREFVEKLQSLAAELGGPITKVQGTGLLFSCELDPVYKAYGTGSAEEYMRINGIGVIHGGENSLRFTPHFEVTSAEVELIVQHVKDALVNGPRKPAA
ncbi:MAG: aminotransferase class III-fold pyridoxal phosphate-dependent enzyme [Longimicrobiales bacterium]|nr:aminotransferase class III-fold pyridoxal phosphate-dependent enzyme [Longimicrobiales bacterium]